MTTPNRDRKQLGDKYLRIGLIVMAVSAILILVAQVTVAPTRIFGFHVLVTVLQYASIPIASGLIASGLVLRELGNVNSSEGTDSPTSGANRP